MIRRFLLAVLGGGLVLAARAAPTADPARDSAWQDLFRRLAPAGSRQAPFTEERYFPFRPKPLVLSGVVRIAPGLGLSLEYRSPARRVIVVDPQGVLVREGGGQRAAPSDRRAQAATAALGAVLRFDPAELARDFLLRGDRQGEAWTLTLVPREAALAGSLRSIVVSGTQAVLGRIELNAGIRIEIILGPALEGSAFPAADLARYFR